MTSLGHNELSLTQNYQLSKTLLCWIYEEKHKKSALLSLKLKKLTQIWKGIYRPTQNGTNLDHMLNNSKHITSLFIGLFPQFLQFINVFFSTDRLPIPLNSVSLQCIDIVNSFDAGDGIFWLWGSIPCLLMPWLLKSPDHQLAWYWLCRIDIIYCCSRVNFIYLGYAKSKMWLKHWIYLL